MNENHKYSCIQEIGAEVLILITSSITVAVIVLSIFANSNRVFQKNGRNLLSQNIVGTMISSAYALFLPLTSYMFSQTKQNNAEGRAQVILSWMVLIEFIRVHGGEGDPNWELKKAGEQSVRLLWVGFLVWSYAPLNGLRASLMVLCALCIIYEILKGISFHLAQHDFLILKGRNPKQTHNYIKGVLHQDDLKTTPMHNCEYVVMGEENHDFAFNENGYRPDKKSDSVTLLTIGRVFQRSSENEPFTLEHTDWRNNCVSLALAKMLRRRFVDLPIDEVGSSKALQFVLEGLIDYIGGNKDIQTDKGIAERNPNRVFDIIQDELKLVSALLHAKVPTYNYFSWKLIAAFINMMVNEGIGIYLFYIIFKNNSMWLSLIVQDGYSHCFFHSFRNGTMVMKFFSRHDQAITVLLFLASLHLPYKLILEAAYLYNPWHNLILVKLIFEYLDKWNDAHTTVTTSNWSKNLARKVNKLNMDMQKDVARIRIVLLNTFPRKFANANRGRKQYSIFDTKMNCMERMVTNPQFSLFNSNSYSTNVCDAILRSLRESNGLLTNGETALRRYGKWEHLNPIYHPNGSTTEAILVWHIATTLFGHQEPRQNNHPKEREVAIDLSNYCHYLVASLPELLPDEVGKAKRMYESVREEIPAIDHLSFHHCTERYRCNICNYIMGEEGTCDKNSVFRKGVKLTKELVNYAKSGTEVWKMLSEFWAEIILFIAPSDNVEGHENILIKRELITQLWALLTHAGILARPKPTDRASHISEIESIEGTE